jgi:phosphoribosylformylglycinamidine synthase subunit PurS
MTFIAYIKIMPKKELLDPQGKAVLNGLHKLNLSGVQDVRVGKSISLSVEAASEADARAMVQEACSKLLANAIMEDFHFEISPA